MARKIIGLAFILLFGGRLILLAVEGPNPEAARIERAIDSISKSQSAYTPVKLPDPFEGFELATIEIPTVAPLAPMGPTSSSTPAAPGDEGADTATPRP